MAKYTPQTEIPVALDAAEIEFIRRKLGSAYSDDMMEALLYKSIMIKLEKATN